MAKEHITTVMENLRRSSDNMRILIVPMAALAETHGPVARCQTMAYGFMNAGLDVATCMAQDMNYRVMNGITNYHLEVPMPLGLPKAAATKVFPLAQKLGISSKKRVDSFDQVLWLTGNLDQTYLRKSVYSIRRAIQEFKPDRVYSEFNISAVIAAKTEGVPVYTTVSYPTQYGYAHDSSLGHGLNRILDELHLPQVESPEKLFDWADKFFCMSIRELEPIEKPNVVYCGSLKPAMTISSSGKRDKIIVYMGNGTISAKKMLRVIRDAFLGGPHEVCIASAYLKKTDIGNIHIAPRWDFDQLLDEAVLFINHGGQNSIADGLIHGVPQIVVPGRVFERRYNAECLLNNKAGIVVDHRDFRADHICKVTDKILDSNEMAENATILGKKLSQAGGIDTLIRNI